MMLYISLLIAAEEQQQEYSVVDYHLVIQPAVRLDNSVFSEVTEQLSVDGEICVSARVVLWCDKRCIGHLRLAIRFDMGDAACQMMRTLILGQVPKLRACAMSSCLDRFSIDASVAPTSV